MLIFISDSFVRTPKFKIYGISRETGKEPERLRKAASLGNIKGSPSGFSLAGVHL